MLVLLRIKSRFTDEEVKHWATQAEVTSLRNLLPTPSSRGNADTVESPANYTAAESMEQEYTTLPHLPTSLVNGGAGDDHDSQLGDTALAKLIEDLLPVQTSSSKDEFTRTEAQPGMSGINIHPSRMIVRKGQTLEINVSHQGIGDELGLALGRCLLELPHLHRLNIKNNRLTDTSLTLLLQGVKQMPKLQSLDLGQNKIDSEASVLLSDFLKQSSCPLKELGMSNADVDDGECVNLVASLDMNQTLTSLDLSRNRIGELEDRNAIDPDFTTGGEAIAELLGGVCALKSLNLSWNFLRGRKAGESACQIGEALATNDTLEELNVAYNSFGDIGGQAMGAALYINANLRKINLESNSICARGAYTIAAGLRSNQSVRHLDMTGNPVGEVGGRALMQVPADLGDRIELEIDRCDMKLVDNSLHYDAATRLPREMEDLPGEYFLDLRMPFRRAIALEMLRMGAESPGFTLSFCSLDNQELSLAPMEAKRKVGTDDDATHLILSAHSNMDKLWDRYDEDSSGTVDRGELTRLLKDIGLDHSESTITRILTTYGPPLNPTRMHAYTVLRIRDPTHTQCSRL